MIQYVARNIKEDWARFLKLMTTGPYEVPDMEGQSPKQTVLDYFDSIAYQIRWGDLKRYLLALERNEMVEYIETRTFITQGMYLLYCYACVGKQRTAFLFFIVLNFFSAKNFPAFSRIPYRALFTPEGFGAY